MLVFDGDCRFCIRVVARLQRMFAPAAAAAPWQEADLAELGLTADQCRAAVQWSQDGSVARGADAVAAWLRTARRNRWLVPLIPLGLPPGRLLYPAVARNRSRLSRLLR